MPSPKKRYADTLTIRVRVASASAGAGAAVVVVQCCRVIVVRWVRCWPCPALSCCRAAVLPCCRAAVLPLSSICACRAAVSSGWRGCRFSGWRVASNSISGDALFLLLPFYPFPPLSGKVIPPFRHRLRSFAPVVPLPCCAWCWFCRVVSGASLGLFCCRAAVLPCCTCCRAAVLPCCPGARCPVSGVERVRCRACPADRWSRAARLLGSWCWCCSAAVLCCPAAAGARNPFHPSNTASTVAGEGGSRRCGSVRTPPQILPPKPFSAQPRQPCYPIPRQPCYPATLLPCNPATLLPCYPATPLPDTTASLHPCCSATLYPHIRCCCLYRGERVKVINGNGFTLYPFSPI